MPARHFCFKPCQTIVNYALLYPPLARAGSVLLHPPLALPVPNVSLPYLFLFLLLRLFVNNEKSLLVETSANGRTWDTLGSWTAPVEGAEDETVCSATVTAANDSANTSRYAPLWEYRIVRIRQPTCRECSARRLCGHASRPRVVP